MHEWVSASECERWLLKFSKDFMGHIDPIMHFDIGGEEAKSTGADGLGVERWSFSKKCQKMPINPISYPH